MFLVELGISVVALYDECRKRFKTNEPTIATVRKIKAVDSSEKRYSHANRHSVNGQDANSAPQLVTIKLL